MNRDDVDSSNLKSVGYDPDSRTLEVEFHHGGIYQYFGVPAQVYESLMRSGSHGQFLAQRIKGVYGYSKLG